MPKAVGEIKMSAKALRDFGVEYSKSGRANCCGCRQKIAKSIVRVKKVVYTTEVGINFGGQPLWHHLECFAKVFCLENSANFLMFKIFENLSL